MHYNDSEDHRNSENRRIKTVIKAGCDRNRSNCRRVPRRHSSVTEKPLNTKLLCQDKIAYTLKDLGQKPGNNAYDQDLICYYLQKEIHTIPFNSII